MELGVIIALCAVGFTVLVQTFAVVWFISRLAARVEFLEKEADAREKERYPDRLMKIETILEIVQRQQDDQLVRLDRVLQNQSDRKAVDLARGLTPFKDAQTG